LDIAHTAEAEVAGVFALIAAGEDGIRRARERTDAPIGSLVSV